MISYCRLEKDNKQYGSQERERERERERESENSENILYKYSD